MRTPLSASFLLSLGLFTSISVSLSLAQDSDGSGLDLEIDDSGDGSADDSTNEITLEDGRRRDFHPSLNVINPPADESEWIILENSKSSFLENPDIRTGVISGGVTGVILAVVITAMLIYKWQKKETERFRKDSDEDYLNRRKGDFIV